jgi:Na+-driven multidrug efflux pump
MNFGVFWLFEIPAAILLAKTWDLGPRGIFYAVTVAFSMLAVVGVLLFRRGGWKTRTV